LTDNRESASSGSRRIESAYAEHEPKYLMVFIFGNLIVVSVLAFVFIHIIFPMSERRFKTVQSNLRILALAVRSYEEEHDEFPDSLEQIERSSLGSAGQTPGELPRKDP
jgi:hypothetical protein